MVSVTFFSLVLYLDVSPYMAQQLNFEVIFLLNFGIVTTKSRAIFSIERVDDIYMYRIYAEIMSLFIYRETSSLCVQHYIYISC